MNIKQLIERAGLCWRILRANPGNLLAHAERELPVPEEEMQELMNAQLKELILVFSTHGHSGFSASYAIGALTKLLKYEPLGPLTGDESEWVDHGYGALQNKRCSHVFKTPTLFDGQAYDIEGVIFEEPNGSCFTGNHSFTPITFPYTPKKRYAKVGFDATSEEKIAAAQLALAQ